jgi:hypothetical protein
MRDWLEGANVRMGKLTGFLVCITVWGFAITLAPAGGLIGAILILLCGGIAGLLLGMFAGLAWIAVLPLLIWLGIHLLL